MALLCGGAHMPFEFARTGESLRAEFTVHRAGPTIDSPNDAARLEDSAKVEPWT